MNLQIGEVICLPIGVPPTPCPGGTFVIGPGDTFFGIARRLGISLESLLAANPGIDPNNLRVGQVICLPPGVPPPVCPGGTLVIRAGDTLFSIARRLGTTVAALLAVNPGIDPNNLQVGQVICLPVPAPGPVPCPGGRIHVVQPGETLFTIARRNGIPLPLLIAANPQITDPNRIQIGQQICIPAVARNR
jgi:LysM repeat protein